MDGGAPFYNVYASKDRRYFAVGCIEPQFFATFVNVRADLFEKGQLWITYG